MDSDSDKTFMQEICTQHFAEILSEAEQQGIPKAGAHAYMLFIHLRLYVHALVENRPRKLGWQKKAAVDVFRRIAEMTFSAIRAHVGKTPVPRPTSDRLISQLFDDSDNVKH